jgi:DNA-binding transcriptional MerR regulator
MSYTVKKLAQMTGLTVRALHHYDQIGLLKPSKIGENGYRYYEHPDLLKLQQILFFRELDFSLETIVSIINSPELMPLQILEEQRKLLKLKKKRLEKMLFTIEKTIQKMKRGETMTDDSLFSNFSDEESKKYQKEAKERWGHTKAYQQSINRTKTWTKAKWDEVKHEGQTITLAMASVMDCNPADPKVQQIVEKFFQHINRFYDLTPEFFRNLGQMYVDDPRFTATYEKIKPGLAIFMRDAMEVFANNQGSYKK